MVRALGSPDSQNRLAGHSDSALRSCSSCGHRVEGIGDGVAVRGSSVADP
jgi:hypothetical protein